VHAEIRQELETAVGEISGLRDELRGVLFAALKLT